MKSYGWSLPDQAELFQLGQIGSEMCLQAEWGKNNHPDDLIEENQGHKPGWWSLPARGYLQSFLATSTRVLQGIDSLSTVHAGKKAKTSMYLGLSSLSCHKHGLMTILNETKLMRFWCNWWGGNVLDFSCSSCPCMIHQLISNTWCNCLNLACHLKTTMAVESERSPGGILPCHLPPVTTAGALCRFAWLSCPTVVKGLDLGSFPHPLAVAQMNCSRQRYLTVLKPWQWKM